MQSGASLTVVIVLVIVMVSVYTLLCVIWCGAKVRIGATDVVLAGGVVHVERCLQRLHTADGAFARPDARLSVKRPEHW